MSTLIDFEVQLTMPTLLPRLHLFEWEDQSFFPIEIRNSLTQYLFMVWTVGRFYRCTLPILQRVNTDTRKELTTSKAMNSAYLLLVKLDAVTFLPGGHISVT